jgi:hypothetical protein
MRAFLAMFVMIVAAGASAQETGLPDGAGDLGLAPIPGYALGAGDDIFADLAAFDVDNTATGADLGALHVFKFSPNAPEAMKAHLIGRYTKDLGALHGDLAGAIRVGDRIWYRLRLVEMNEWYRYDAGLDAILQYMEPKGVTTREALDFLTAFDQANGS